MIYVFIMSGPGSGVALYFDDHIAYKRRLNRRPEATLLSVSFTYLECRKEAAIGATSTPLLSICIADISYDVTSVQYL
jgi:hypothetical protein